MELEENDYTKYKNLPTINGVPVVGELTLQSLGIINEEMTAEELEHMWDD